MDEHRRGNDGDDKALTGDDQHLIDRVRAEQPDGPDSTAFWESFARRAGDMPVRQSNRQEAIELARLALAVSRGELTLASYLRELRRDAGLSREELGREVRLSPDAIGEIEGERGQVVAIEPNRLARWVVSLGALKRVFLELVRQAAATPPPGTSISPRLTRLDTTASRLDSERAARRTGAAIPTVLEEYISRVSDAFDVELARTRRS